MAIQIWNRDQVPELSVLGKSGLGSGIAGLGAGIGRHLEQAKRINTAGAAAKKFNAALIEASDDDETTKAMRREANKGQSARQAIAEMTGTQQAQGYATAQAHFKAALEQAAGLKAERENLAKAPAFFKRLNEAGTPPGDLPFDIAPAEFDRRTAPRDAAIIEALAATGHTPTREIVNLLDALKQSSAVGGDVFAKLGMVPTGGQVNPNLTASVNYGMPPTPPPPVVVPPGLEPRTLTVDPSGKASTTYGITDKAKALTDAQANALQYSDRMKFNNTVIEHLEGQGFSPASVGSAVQGVLPNYLSTEASQQYQAAARNWVSAVLRKESGAAISKSEEVAAMRQYFPALGDGPAVIRQKADLRRLAEENMRRAVGSIDEPPAGPKAPPKTPRAGLAPPGAAGTNRVVVTDGTRKFYLPAEQLSDAIKEGYQQVK